MFTLRVMALLTGTLLLGACAGTCYDEGELSMAPSVVFEG